MSLEIKVQKTDQLKTPPDSQDLGFGKHFTDHMFTLKYSRKLGWHSPRVEAYSPFQMDPAASVFHYGQALFEGLKAFRQTGSPEKIAVFRPDFNWQRMAQGADRLCMPTPSAAQMTSGLMALLDVDRNWIPRSSGASLYIRPTLVATEGFLGVRPADEYLFFIILSPVGSYFSGSDSGVKIWIENEDLRAAPGGLGATKAAANYAASLRASMRARAQGYAQVLWLDPTKKYIDEVGTMNIFFVFKDHIATPKLNGSILAGGTRECVLRLLNDQISNQGPPVQERDVSLAEIRDGLATGNLLEAFGTGTAAVITPIAEFSSKDFSARLPEREKSESLSQQLHAELTGMQRGTVPDRHGWLKFLDDPRGESNDESSRQ